MVALPETHTPPPAEAVSHFSTFNPINIAWRPTGELSIVALSPNNDSEQSQQRVSRTMEHLKALSGEKPMRINHQVERGNLVISCSGEGALQAARTLRDKAHLQFTGCASLPEGRVR